MQNKRKPEGSEMCRSTTQENCSSGLDRERVEDYLRHEINEAWLLFKGARVDSAAYEAAFVRYCRALYESTLYAAYGNIPAVLRDALPGEPDETDPPAP